jgi:hypothetical protein
MVTTMADDFYTYPYLPTKLYGVTPQRTVILTFWNIISRSLIDILISSPSDANTSSFGRTR